MLPISVSKYIPSFLVDNADAAMLALIAKIDDHIAEWRDEIFILQYLKVADRCPGGYLDEYGNYVAATLYGDDSERDKRIKIYNAINIHKKRSLWTDHVKIIIDLITGYDARLYSTGSGDNDDSIDLARQTTDPDYYWSTEQDFSTTNPLWGTADVGNVDDLALSGNIAVDCHYGIYTAVLSAAQIAEIILQVRTEAVPAYMLIHLGYVDTSNNFVEYAGGEI
jgi:hypothetical protein